MPSLIVDKPVICQVVEYRTADLARLALKIETSRETAGRYSLTVRKSDPAGTATMQQGGRFTVAVGESREVGQVSVSVMASGQLSVDGYLQIDDQKIGCTYIRNDEL